MITPIYLLLSAGGPGDQTINPASTGVDTTYGFPSIQLAAAPGTINPSSIGLRTTYGFPTISVANAPQTIGPSNVGPATTFGYPRVTGPDTPSLPLSGFIADDFNDGQVDFRRWRVESSGARVTEKHGVLNIELPTANGRFGAYHSARGYNLTLRSIFVQTNFTRTGQQNRLWFTAEVDDANLLFFRAKGTLFQAGYLLSNQETILHSSSTYTPGYSNPRAWWRFRNTGGSIVVWETSRNGRLYTQVGSASITFPLTDLSIFLEADNTQTEAQPNVAQFDSLNTRAFRGQPSYPVVSTTRGAGKF